MSQYSNIQKMAIGDFSGFMLREDVIEAQIDKETDGESLVSLDQEDTTISTVIKQGEQPQNNAQDDDDDDNLTSFTL